MLLSSRVSRVAGGLRPLTIHSTPRTHIVQRRRSLHLAPPFLLDDYTPRYQQLSSVDAALKRSQAYAHLRNCNLCPRECGVNRYETTGMCLIGAETVAVNTIAPHFGEEPCIQVSIKSPLIMIRIHHSFYVHYLYATLSRVPYSTPFPLFGTVLPIDNIWNFPSHAE